MNRRFNVAAPLRPGGLSLVELLVATGVGSLLFLGAGRVFDMFNANARAHDLKQEETVALDTLNQTMRRDFEANDEFQVLSPTVAVIFKKNAYLNAINNYSTSANNFSYDRLYQFIDTVTWTVACQADPKPLAVPVGGCAAGQVPVATRRLCRIGGGCTDSDFGKGRFIHGLSLNFRDMRGPPTPAAQRKPTLRATVTYYVSGGNGVAASVQPKTQNFSFDLRKNQRFELVR